MISEVLLPAAAARGSLELVVADELVDRARRERPELATVPPREQLLVAAWLSSLRSVRTRRAYAGDLLTWLGWLAERDLDVLAAARVHVDLWGAPAGSGGCGGVDGVPAVVGAVEFLPLRRRARPGDRDAHRRRGPPGRGPRPHRHRWSGP